MDSEMEVSKLVRLIRLSQTDSMPELARICGRDIKRDYKGADLSEVNLSGVDLSDGDFSYTDFTGANLSDVNFSGANLKGAIFVSANLEGAILVDAMIDDADFTNTLLDTSAKESGSREKLDKDEGITGRLLAKITKSSQIEQPNYSDFSSTSKVAPGKQLIDANVLDVNCQYRNTSDRMVILRCLGPDGFFLERVVFPFEMLNFACPKDSEVKIWTHGLGGPELVETILVEELVINEHVMQSRVPSSGRRINPPADQHPPAVAG